jgi:spore coat protein U-like protein
MTIAGDNGLNFNGTRNLKSAAGDLIPYSLAGLPQSRSGPGNDNYVPFTFNGSILWSAYANASAGSYSDTVIISVTP